MLMDDFTDAIQLTIESSLSGINTSMPGKVVSYNAATNRAVVRPSLPKQIDSGEVLDPPKIVEVPVQWHAAGGGNVSFTMPLKPGDDVLLSFQQRSMEGYLNGNNSAPDDPRQFDLTDCVAIPGGGASGIVGHSDNVVLKFGNANVTLKPDGTIIFGNGGGNITIDSGGNMTLHASTITIDAGGKHFNLEHHVHKEVQRGGELSGEPNP